MKIARPYYIYIGTLIVIPQFIFTTVVIKKELSGSLS